MLQNVRNQWQLVTEKEFNEIIDNWDTDKIKELFMECICLLDLNKKKLKELDEKGFFKRIWLFFGGRRKIHELALKKHNELLELMLWIQEVLIKRTDMLLIYDKNIDLQLKEHIIKYNDSIKEINKRLDALEIRTEYNQKLTQLYNNIGKRIDKNGVSYKELNDPDKIIRIMLDIREASGHTPVYIEDATIQQMQDVIEAPKDIRKSVFFNEILGLHIIDELVSDDMVRDYKNMELSSLGKEMSMLIANMNSDYFKDLCEEKGENDTYCFVMKNLNNYISKPDENLNSLYLIKEYVNDMNKEFVYVDKKQLQKEKEEILKALTEEVRMNSITEDNEFKAYINYLKGKFVYENGELKSTSSMPSGLDVLEGMEISNLNTSKTAKLSAQKMYILLWASNKKPDELRNKNVIAIDWTDKIHACWYKFDENGMGVSRQGEIEIHTLRTRKNVVRDIVKLTGVSIRECICLLCFTSDGSKTCENLLIRLTDKVDGPGAIPLNNYASSITFDDNLISWLFDSSFV